MSAPTGFKDLSPKAWLAVRRSVARVNIWEGAVRSCKTYSTLFKWVYYVKHAPPGDLLLTAKTFDTLRTNIINPIIDIVGSENARYLAGSRKFYLFGREHVCRGANDESAEERIRGMTIAGALGDELTLWPESYYVQLMARMSVPGAQFFGTTNPDAPAHWLKKTVIDPRHEMNAKARLLGQRDRVRVFHFDLVDNPTLAAEYVDSIKAMYTGLWYDRMILGKWTMAEGAIWDMFNTRRHVVDVAAIKAARARAATKGADYPRDGRFKRYIVGVDYGTSNATSFLLIGFDDPNGPYYVEKEYHYAAGKEGKRQKTDAQYGADFMAFIKGYRVNAIYVDPAAASFQAELRHRGLFIKDADNSVLDGIRFVGTQFSRTAPLRSGVHVPALMIDKRCTDLTDEIQSYVWDAKAQARGEDKPVKVDDHGPDALRYALYTHFGQGPSGVLAGIMY